MFNTFLPCAPPGHRTSFDVLTWNARSLFCADRGVMHRKLTLLQQNIKNKDIVCIQETKGSLAMVDRHMRLIKRTHWVFCNFSKKSINAGGVIVLVSKQSAPFECITHGIIIPGRVSRVLIQGVGCKQIVYNIHNFELDLPVVVSAIKADLDECSVDTMSNNLIACGDLNIPSVVGRVFDYSTPKPTIIADSGEDRGLHAGRQLRNLLADARLVEIEPGAPTRYNSTCNTGSTIDRIFLNTAPHYFPMSRWTSTILQDPKTLFTKGISDHAMVQASATFIPKQEAGEGIPPVEYFTHHMFQHFYEALLNQTKVNHFTDPWIHQLYLTEIIRAAALYVREWTQDLQETGPFYTDAALTAISRVVWTQDVTLAKKLKENSPLARTHIQINDPETSRFTVELVNPPDFSDACNKAKTEILRIKSTENDRRPPSEAKAKCASKLNRLAKLWIPFGKALTLHGVITDGVVISEEPAKTLALGAAWQPTFSEKEFDELAASQYLQDLGNIGEYSNASKPPDFFHLQEGSTWQTQLFPWAGQTSLCSMGLLWDNRHSIFIRL